MGGAPFMNISVRVMIPFVVLLPGLRCQVCQEKQVNHPNTMSQSCKLLHETSNVIHDKCIEATVILCNIYTCCNASNNHDMC